MCGRLIGGDRTQAEMAELVNGFLYPTKAISIDASAPDPATGYNIAPTQQVSLLYPEADGQLIASSARWWFVPPWHKGDVKDWKATTFNAKIETAFEKPTFRQSWNSGRCLILASGYYEWSGPKTDKQPHRIYVEQNQPIMLFAGLQSKRRDGMRSCTILTRAALPEIQELHPRMPVVLNSDEAERWLSGADSNDTIQAEYGTQWQGRFRHHRVAKFGARDDGPELIEEFNDRLF
ncbi:MAG: SOS response-associated peptidase [Litoreibacter sp.]|uniref:SOS response-associated peptidase n=1 Tax=Litoreibacter sp. TaxID=1969459 RepID=UPI0032986C0C